jgi:hypothetical protein
MKRLARRFTVREKTFGLAVEFFCGTPQSTALRRCVAILQLDANDPENSPDEGDAAWAMCFNSHAVVWLEDATDIGSLVHELYHVTAHVLRHIESNDEETGAYIQLPLPRSMASPQQETQKPTMKSGLYANINAKQKRIAAGSGEKMRKPGSAGAPTAKAFKQSAKTAKTRR